MTKKSGTAGSIVQPLAPKAAVEAANADPGAVTSASSKTTTGKSGKLTQPPVKPYKPPETQEEKERKCSWIEIEMVGEDDKPIAGERFQVTLPDGSVAEGTLDDKGFARVDGFEPGSCKVSFPDLDQDAWEDA